ncbi:MAG TPA: DUF5658 family protein [Steroidobacteraceae bacterium]|jgi:hypothetical protein|nr:DUF5658 family protein [Steroidobacteraceae bacterium]
MSSFPPTPEQFAAREPSTRPGTRERRHRPDRRRRFWWSLFYGGLHPRRRRPSRRLADGGFQALDWHGTHLWAASVGILILNVVDAFLTLRLLSVGAVEANPLMALFVSSNVGVFAGLKMAMTGACVILMVLLSGYRFMRVVRVDVILYGILLAYVALIAHEIAMLRQLADAVIL